MARFRLVRALFIHQNFPGQYRHIAAYLAAQPGNQVAAIGEKSNLVRQRVRIAGVTLLGYTLEEKPVDPFAGAFLKAVARGRAVAAAAARLRREGFSPDLIFAHIGWGEAVFLKDLFPDAKLLLYGEFFYRARGSDVGFDPEFPASPEKLLRLRAMNAPLLMSLDVSDWVQVPTRWQQSQLPEAYLPRTSIIHDGIDTDLAAPGGMREDGLVTYVARNLEPYRGFHVFMRAIPHIQRQRPNVRIVVVGGDEVSYSARLPPGETYRERMLRELGDKIDLQSISFLGRIPYVDYLALLRKSSVHVYLTYPFVLSWSVLEAMACGCVVVGSRTAPVEEVITHEDNGFLVDFFDAEGIAASVVNVLARQEEFGTLRQRARQTVFEKFDLKRVCLPAQLELAERLIR